MGARKTIERDSAEFEAFVGSLRHAANGGDEQSGKMLRRLRADLTLTLESEHMTESGQWTCPAGVHDVVTVGKGGDAGTAAGPGAPGWITIYWLQPKLD